MSWRDVSAVLPRRGTDPGTWEVEHIRLGDLTPTLVASLRSKYHLPDDACPLCVFTGSSLMRIRPPVLDDTHRKLYGEDQATAMLQLGVLAKCVCLATLPTNGSDEEKARALRELRLPPAEEVAALGLDFGWRPPEKKKRAKRRSFEEVVDEADLPF